MAFLGIVTTKVYTLNVLADVLGGRYRPLETVPLPMEIIMSAVQKQQEVPEIPISSQLPSSPQESITTPLTTGAQSLTQLVEAPKAGAGELKLAGFPISTFLLVGLGLGAILFFGAGKHVS